MRYELLRQVRLLDPVSDTDRTADVLLTEGRVEAIADSLTNLPADTRVTECKGQIVAPGLVDLYSHSGEPGFEERETLESLLKAAAAGGFTRVAILPDTAPAIDNPASVTWVQTHRENLGTALPALYCWGALTLGAKGEQMTELGDLAATPVVGFADGRPITNLTLIRRLLEYGQPLRKPIALWCNNPELAGNGVMREGLDSMKLGLPGISAYAETAALAAVLECVEAIQTPVHLMRVSTARGVELIQAAKERRVPITASTPWINLILDTEALGSYDPNLRLNPPLGNPSDRQALVEAVRTGVVDAIAIDHTPYTYEEKTVAFAEAPSGTIGLELALPLLWQKLVESGTWSALELWRALSSRPAVCLNQPAPLLQVGQPTEMILFDPTQPWAVETAALKSRSSNTFWLRKPLTGRVLQTWFPPGN